MASVEELIDKYVIAVNNQYGIPDVTEVERHALASEYLRIQGDIKRKTGLSRIGMSVENHDELQDLSNRAEVIFNFIGQTLAGDSKIAPTVTRTYISQVEVNDKMATETQLENNPRLD